MKKPAITASVPKMDLFQSCCRIRVALCLSKSSADQHIRRLHINNYRHSHIHESSGTLHMSKIYENMPIMLCIQNLDAYYQIQPKCSRPHVLQRSLLSISFTIVDITNCQKALQELIYASCVFTKQASKIADLEHCNCLLLQTKITT